MRTVARKSANDSRSQQPRGTSAAEPPTTACVKERMTEEAKKPENKAQSPEAESGPLVQSRFDDLLSGMLPHSSL